MFAVRDKLTGAVYPQPNKTIAEKVAEMHGHCEVIELARQGAFRYGLRVDENEVYTSWSAWSFEPFASADDVRECWKDNPEAGEVVRAWVPPAGSWEPVPEKKEQ